MAKKEEQIRFMKGSIFVEVSHSGINLSYIGDEFKYRISKKFFNRLYPLFH